MRAFFTSSIASVKLEKLRITPGIPSDVTLKKLLAAVGVPSEDTVEGALSPKKAERISAAAPLRHECAEGYSGKAGVTINGVQFASGTVAGFVLASASVMAVTG